MDAIVQLAALMTLGVPETKPARQKSPVTFVAATGIADPAVGYCTPKGMTNRTPVGPTPPELMVICPLI